MRSTVGLEGEGALPQKIARFSGDPCIGLEELARETPVISSRRREILSFHSHQLWGGERCPWGGGCRPWQHSGQKDRRL